ncbi:Glucose--fructose oxidoreductase precursor [Planctomycetes bacterium Pan216]|uniref:Glucose--fructose oxidoreductase n=1 Tax=Kolteria novifilia TaxID=2527975 RepID=A0A518B364_9BACT|nr:Glucose--fructose oxidoreductase precursor [Planctomycetes bacterium Pan216]
MSKPAKKGMSRRKFVASAAASTFAFTYIPSRVWGANERVAVAGIGIGGKGYSDVMDVSNAGGQIVALCDVDDKQAKGSEKRPGLVKKFPDAPYFHDFREMLDKLGDKIDAVTVSTPDHTHTVASAMAMKKGKHVYCQKPLTRTIWEARYLTDLAKETGVATQMGNQAHAGEGVRRAVELVRAGVIGKVKEVHTWTNRPIWPQGMTELPKGAPVPETLAWDLWLGPADYTDYSPEYCPFKWRGWWAYGTGALGDMGCHIMDTPYWALDLKQPTKVSATSQGNTDVSGPKEATVTYTFPGNDYAHDGLTFAWYDGNRNPDMAIFEGLDLTSKDKEGKSQPIKYTKFDYLLIGDEGKLIGNRGNTNFIATDPKRVAEYKEKTPKTLPRCKNEDAEWLEACKGGPAAQSNFAQAGPFTEAVLLGNLAIRLNKTIEWDGAAMKATNAPEAAALIKPTYRSGWEL